MRSKLGRLLVLACSAGAVGLLAGCVSIASPTTTTYAGTQINNQKDSAALNVSGSNGTNALREAEGEPGRAGGFGPGEQTAANGTRGSGLLTVVAGNDVSQTKAVEDLRSVASIQKDTRGSSAPGGDGSRGSAEGGNVSPTTNATGRGDPSQTNNGESGGRSNDGSADADDRQDE